MCIRDRGWGVELSGRSWRFGLLQHGFEGLLPVLAIEVEGGSGSCAVKKRIGRPFSRCRVVRSCDRLDGCGRVDEPQVSTDFAHGHRHVVPAGGAGITPVHDGWQFAVTSALKGFPAGLSKVEGAGGTAHLIGDNTQLIPFPVCLLYTSPSPRDLSTSRMPSSA